ncbi:MAG: radical SAM/SPASM domain-containing protein [Candidatus Binatia bacterium]
MQHKYRFHHTPELEDLVVDVENRGEKIVVDVSGPRADDLGPFVEAYFQSFNEIGPLTCHEGRNVYSLYWPPVPSEAHARFVEAFWNTWFFGRQTPPVVTFAITDKCQCRCVHCGAATFDGKRSEISLSDMERIVAECVALGVTNVIYTGGEPLLHRDLEACVALVPKEKAVAQVFSNAVALDAARLQALKAAGLYAIKISLDSPNPDEHDRLRGRPGVFAAVERGVRASLDAGLLVGLSTYATNESVRTGHLPRVVELAAGWGIHEITVFDAHTAGRFRQREDVTLTPESRRELLEQSRRLNAERAPRPRIITQSWTNTSSKFAKYVGCLAATSQFHITPSGDFTPCDFTPLSFGNVLKEPISTLWQKLVTHPAYKTHCQECRMQSRAFRAKYVDAIPENAILPYPIERLGD